MAKKKSVEKATKVRALPVRKDSKVKGGGFSIGNVAAPVKTIGEALTTAARKQ